MLRLLAACMADWWLPRRVLAQRRRAAARPDRRVIVVTFGGGARYEDTLAPEGWINIPHLATELVRLPVDIIVAPGTAAAVAARKATATLPVVLVLAANPIGDGLIESFSRPGTSRPGSRHRPARPAPTGGAAPPGPAP